MTFALVAALAAVLSVGNVRLAPSDYLDGRAIAGADGKPVVMLTLTPAALARLKRAGTVAMLDGKPAKMRLVEQAIELDGVADFKTAEALALALTGKPPVPESLDE